MKVKFATLIAAVLFVAALAMAADTSMTGWISDSKCGAKGANAAARDCTIKCVKEGAKYVFVNDADKKVYAIDKQEMVAEHAGHHVTVTGMVEGDSLKLDSIKMAPEKEMMGKKMGKM
jgi:cytoskeletal protein CcmA (bactofilin family)